MRNLWLAVRIALMLLVALGIVDAGIALADDGGSY